MAKRISHYSSIKLNTVRVSNGIVEDNRGWRSEKLSRPAALSWTFQADKSVWLNCLTIAKHSQYPELFPSNFRIEYSEDNKIWRILFREYEYSGKEQKEWQFSLIHCEYIKMIALCDKRTAEKSGFQLAIGKVEANLSGFRKIEASSEFNRLWTKENIIDGRADYGWSTKPVKEKTKEFLLLDMGYTYPISELRLLSAQELKNSESLFPKGFLILLSNDCIHWDVVIQYENFISEPNTWYTWKLPGLHSRYIKISIFDPNQNMSQLFQSKITEVEVYAMQDYDYGSGTDSQVAASTTQAGIVRLAVSGEELSGTAVQGSDLRLKPATENKLGIVELAAHRERGSQVVVQGDDPRLLPANTANHGVVRIANPREITSDKVVAADDPRLNMASELEPGLVRLARDCGNASGDVVQANDRRLRYATRKNAGIVQFAENQNPHPNRVISSDDSRLLSATSERAGITRYARHGQKIANKAVQSDDPRLADATTYNLGIVRLARDGEVKKNLVIQSDDHRLQKASTNNTGIVQIAKSTQEGSDFVIAADDRRLKDAREPLPHEHDYASKNHSFSSHTGTIYLSKNQGKQFSGWSSPPKNYSPIIGQNQGKGSGIVGESKDGEGVLAIGNNVGVLGMSGGDEGTAVLGLSRKGTGGHFISEHNCSLIAGGSKRGVQGSPYAFLARGLSAFEDTIFLNRNSCIAIAFSKNSNENLNEGDVIVLHEKNGTLTKVKKYGDTRVIGIITNRASLIMNANLDDEDQSEQVISDQLVAQSHLVAVTGVVRVKVTSYPAPISRGDLLVSSDDIGYLQKLDNNRYQVGMICARSLENLEKGKSLIKVMLFCA